MSAPSTSGGSDTQAALAVCIRLLESLKIPGSAGRAQFLSALAPQGTACHARAMVNGDVEYEQFGVEFANRMPWDTIEANELEEGLDGEPTVLLDHDLAMVWTPYYFTRKGSLSHVGTNCFTLVKRVWENAGDAEWKVCGMTDTARFPTEEDKKRLNKGSEAKFWRLQ